MTDQRASERTQTEIDALDLAPRGPVPSAHAIPPDMKIGHYHVKRVIAAGGMGVVYEALQEHPRRVVALKIMKQGIASRSALRRFEYESQILARLRHPGIAAVYEAGMHEDPSGFGQVPYFAMEYVAGAKDLIAYAGSNRLGTSDRLELFCKVCDAVHHGHQKGIIHRDLKPANILVDAAGQPKIIDFGVARSTDSDLAVTTLQTNVGQLVGTMQFMSPEQIDADPLNIDTRSDVYSLGVVLYQLLTGRLPYDVSNLSIYEATRIVRDQVPQRIDTAANPALRGDLETIILKALEKDRSVRYQSALELSQDIQRFLSNHPITARPPSFTYHFRTFARRNRVLVSTVAGVFVALLLGVAAFAWQAKIARHQRDEAQVQRTKAERRFDQVRTLAKKFMYDFHDMIQTLDGSLAARAMLVTTALEYLDGAAKEAGDNLALIRELASAYDHVGDIRRSDRNPSQGDVEGALANYRTAADLRARAVRAQPEDLALLHEVSASHVRIADSLGHLGDTGGALAEYREAVRIREDMARRDEKYQRQLGTALIEVGESLAGMGRSAEARAHCERGLKLRRALLAEAPGNRLWQRDLTVALLSLGSLLAEIGRHDEAIAHFEEAIAIRTELTKNGADPGATPDLRSRRDLAVAHYYLGDLSLELGRASEAMPHLEHFFEACRRQARTNEDDARSRRDLAVAHEAIGRAHLLSGDADRARESFQQFRALALAVSAAAPGDRPLRALAARSDLRLGELAAQASDFAAALEHFTRSLEAFAALAAGDAQNAELQAFKARLFLEQGKARAAGGDAAGAAESLESARALYESLTAAQPDSVELNRRLAETLEAMERVSG